MYGGIGGGIVGLFVYVGVALYIVYTAILASCFIVDRNEGVFDAFAVRPVSCEATGWLPWPRA